MDELLPGEFDECFLQFKIFFCIVRAMHSNLIVALDVPTLAEAESIVEKLDDTVNYYKVGNQLFTRVGPAAVEMLRARGKKVFLDLKFHDIPNTVAAAVASAAALGVTMVNVHASGGATMMQAAVKSIASANPRPLLIGVTVLTSLDTATLNRLGIRRNAADQVLFLSRVAKRVGLDGVVASPREIALIRRAYGKEFVIVTPGVRPSGAAKGDQKRVMTPRMAVSAGANYLVIGRPILAASNPAETARAILAEMRST